MSVDVIEVPVLMLEVYCRFFYLKFAIVTIFGSKLVAKNLHWGGGSYFGDLRELYAFAKITLF